MDVSFIPLFIMCITSQPRDRIPEREFELRKDMRAERVFTIDPETAKDLDDAFSVEVNEDGTYDISVHIADVSHFVKANTALDRDARKRATSVYLVQRAVPMLPPILSEQLCSLVPGEERLAFTITFTMTNDARILKKWFGKTIIKYVLVAFPLQISSHFTSDLQPSSHIPTRSKSLRERISPTCLFRLSTPCRTSLRTSRYSLISHSNSEFVVMNMVLSVWASLAG
jgi:hypothetical protein